MKRRSRNGPRITDVLIYILILICRCSSECGEYGWFGSDICQYKCHCDGNSSCDKVTGRCFYRCADGWFGPACQYASLNYYGSQGSADLSWLTDKSSTTCNDRTVQSLTVLLYTPQPLSWIRLAVKDSASSQIMINYTSSEDVIYMCPTDQTAIVDNTTLDISCTSNVLVRQLTLSGSGVGGLCSMHISGGRNVALKQNGTRQSSTHGSWYASNAVDGKTGPNGHLYCTHTWASSAFTTRIGSWELRLSPPVMIYKYIIYNREDCCQNRLIGFTLNTWDKAQQFYQSYKDTHKEAKEVYTIASVSDKAVSLIEIRSADYSGILTLCEVEVYGERLCPSHMYGLDCQWPCNCADNGQCLVSTGGCPSGCASGYRGENCWTECPQGKYGLGCQETCSSHCKNNATCHHDNGHCLLGCVPGYQTPLCKDACSPTKYGQDCSKNCSNTCVDSKCDHVTGHCGKCQPGYVGEFCDQACQATYHGDECKLRCSPLCGGRLCRHETGKCYNCTDYRSGDFCEIVTTSEPPPPQEGGEVSGAMVIGIVVAVSLLLLVLAGILVWCGYNRDKESPRRLEEEEEKGDVPIEMNAIARSPGPSLGGPQRPAARKTSLLDKFKSTVRVMDDTPDSVYGNVLPNNTALPVSGLREYLLKDTTAAALKQQFNSVPDTNSYSQAEGLLPANVKKNRYKNIVPYNHARVLLRVNAEKGHTDYINASYVKGYNDDERFIAAQAPNDQTLEDFIRMLWEQEVDRIVMLTKLVELRKTKCTQYWPIEGEEEFGEISVRLLMTQVFAEYTIRHLQLTKHGEGRREVLQFHFTAWPDKSVPDSPWGLVDFHQRVHSTRGQGPLLVHCSAGVGRTGTFIGLCNLLKEAEKTGKMDFLSTLWKIRQDRMMMIQTVDQYTFLHRVALVGHVTSGTCVKARDMIDRLGDLEKKNRAGYARQFRSISEICCDQSGEPDAKSVEGEDVYMNSRTTGNRIKNRLNNVLPKEKYRPPLTCETKSLGNYINAVLVPSFRKDRHNILTQVPLPSTVNDFWRLVTQYQVGLVVAFEADTSLADETIGQFLPSNDEEPIRGALFEIQSHHKAETDLWKEVFITVFKKRRSLLGNSAEQHKTTVLLCKKSDLEPHTLLDLLKKVKTFTIADSPPTLYMCRNGAALSGLACVQSLLLDRLENDQCLTVPLVVGAIKAIRPQVIPTVDQYWCLHQVLKLAQDGSNVYGNIGDARRRNSSQDSEPSMSASNPPPGMGRNSQSLPGKGRNPAKHGQPKLYTVTDSNDDFNPGLAEGGQGEKVWQAEGGGIPTEGRQVTNYDQGDEDDHAKVYANL